MRFTDLLEWILKRLVPSSVVLELSPGGEFDVAVFTNEEKAKKRVEELGENMVLIANNKYFTWLRYQHRHLFHIKKNFLRIGVLRIH